MTLKNLLIPILVGVVLMGQFSCTVKWTESVHFGKVTNAAFSQSVGIQIKNKLILVPVTIRGREYRFLFDTAAPFCISKEIQRNLSYRRRSRGHIVDSDNNRTKVDWVQVDSILIGDVSFSDQVAFVGSFNENPVLRCLGIDGIVGSNLQRFCNWTIDQEEAHLLLGNSVDTATWSKAIHVPFKTDNQYNIFVNVHIGQTMVENMLIDFGSNSSITLNKELFHCIAEDSVLDKIVVEKGVQQFGIIGNPVGYNRVIAQSDSVRIGGHSINDVSIKTGRSSSIGNGVLSRFKIAIDWDRRLLLLYESHEKSAAYRSNGVRLGYSPDQGVYVQSVLENSRAFKEGVRLNMRVVRVDDLEFKNESDFCNYVLSERKEIGFLQLINAAGHRFDVRLDELE